MKRTILTGLLAIAISVPCWAGYPEVFSSQAEQNGQTAPSGYTDPFGQYGYGRPVQPTIPGGIGQQSQDGQQNQGGQVEQNGQSGQSGQCDQVGKQDQAEQSGQAGQTDQVGQSDKTDSYEYPGQSGQCGQSDQSGQTGQSDQSGQSGQSNGGCCGQSGYDTAKLQAVISLLSMVESDLSMCAASTGNWANNIQALGYINSARSALERAPMAPAWKPLLAEIYERLGRIRFHLLMNDDYNARMMMNEVQAVVRSTMQTLLINSGNGGRVILPPTSTTSQFPRVIVMPQIPTSNGNYGSNHGSHSGSNSGSSWGSAWGSGWASGSGNGNGSQLPGGVIRPTPPVFPSLPWTNRP